MPQFAQGDMWSAFDAVDHFVITTNAFIKNNGALVMGRGIAKQVRDKYIGVDLIAGDMIKSACGHLGFYGVIGSPNSQLWLFQVKRHFQTAAELDLIEESARMLAERARVWHNKTFALNFPGIGNGRLDYAQVKPLLDVLPNNVTVWSFS